MATWIMKKIYKILNIWFESTDDAISLIIASTNEKELNHYINKNFYPIEINNKDLIENSDKLREAVDALYYHMKDVFMTMGYSKGQALILLQELCYRNLYNEAEKLMQAYIQYAKCSVFISSSLKNENNFSWYITAQNTVNISKNTFAAIVNKILPSGIDIDNLTADVANGVMIDKDHQKAWNIIQQGKDDAIALLLDDDNDDDGFENVNLEFLEEKEDKIIADKNDKDSIPLLPIKKNKTFPIKVNVKENACLA